MKLCILVRNPIVHDGRILRQIRTLSASGLDVTALGVVGRHDARPPSDDLPGCRCMFIDRTLGTSLGGVRWFIEATAHHVARDLLARAIPWSAVAAAAVAPHWLEMAARAALVRADVYHCNDIDTLPSGALAAAWNGAEYVYDAHEFCVGEQEGMPHHIRAARWDVERRLAQRAAGVITVSEHVSAAMSQLYAIADPVVVRNAPEVPSDLPDKRSVTERQELRLLYHGANIGLEARGVADLLAAMSQLPVHVTLAIRGRMARNVREEIEGILAANHLGGRVTLCPRVPPRKLIPLAAASDIGISCHRPTCASLRWAIAVKHMEYYAAGLAVIATETPGTAEIMTHGREGLFYRAGDVAALVQQIQRLDADREMLKRLQRNARQRALEDLNWTRESGRLAGFYRKRFATERPLAISERLSG